MRRAHGSAIFLFPLALAIPPNHQRPLGHLQPSTSPSTVASHINSSLYYSLEESSRVVDIAYCVGNTDIKPPFSCLSRCDDFPTFRLLQTWNTGPLLSDSSGYLAYDHNPSHKRIIAAFRGTYSIPNAIADLSALPQKYVPYLPEGNSTFTNLSQAKCENCTVHLGFLQSWHNARSVIMPTLIEAHATHQDYTIEVIGHSLGGAVALLASLEMLSRGWSPIVTTFGEPRVGNAEFVAHVDDKFRDGQYRRVTHLNDPVPVLPPKDMNYRSHANEIYIAKSDLPQSPDDVRACKGDEDPACSDPTSWMQLWEMLFAHRDYFVRLGVCAPGGDPVQWRPSIPGLPSIPGFGGSDDDPK